MSEIEFIQGKSQKTLTDAIRLERFDNILNNPEKFQIACKISDLIDNFVKGEEKDGEIYNLIADSLGSKVSYQYFFWNFFSELGYRPEVEKCARCGQKLIPYNIYFSNGEGGVVCKKCGLADRGALKINSDIVKILRLILKKNWNIFSRLKVEQNSRKMLEEISNNYYFYFLPKHE